MLKIVIDSKYYRKGFDDWLAGGTVEYRGRAYFWSARDSNYGFGWEVNPITDEDWNGISEEEVDPILTSIRKCLYQHKTEYAFPDSNLQLKVGHA